MRSSLEQLSSMLQTVANITDNLTMSVETLFVNSMEGFVSKHIKAAADSGSRLRALQEQYENALHRVLNKRKPGLEKAPEKKTSRMQRMKAKMAGAPRKSTEQDDDKIDMGELALRFVLYLQYVSTVNPYCSPFGIGVFAEQDHTFQSPAVRDLSLRAHQAAQ